MERPGARPAPRYPEMDMLRSTRVLLLLAFVLMLGAVGASWYRQKSTLSREAPKPPKSLPLDTATVATDWVLTKDQGGRIVYEVRARDFRQLNEPSRLELDNVEIRLFKPDGNTFDRISCARAQFDQASETLYSEGDVEINMGMPVDGAPPGRLLAIRGSGVRFDVKTSVVSTDREVSFTFDFGGGKAVGAVYNPVLRELLMKSQVELHWHGGQQARPMKLEAQELTYREADSIVLLPAWSRFTRDGVELNATNSVVTLEEGMIRKIEGKQARGAAVYPDRKVEYAADDLLMFLNAGGEIEKVVGSRNAHVAATSDSARTRAYAGRVELDFDTAAGESVLTRALAMDNALMESVPLPRKGVQPPETRRLRSEAIVITMRKGGREVASVETHAPGRLEFLPNHQEQRWRTLDAERLSIFYGPENRIESFSAYKAATRTDPAPHPPGDKRPPDPPVLTWSNDLRAAFNPKTGQLARLEQWTNFRYEEGDRRARAFRAVLEEARGMVVLEQAARVWDSSGSTAADRITLDQKSGDVLAEGNVVSMRLPEKKGASSPVLSQEEPLNARAARMTTAERNQKIHYEGGVTLWQGANRIWADSLDIDRAGNRLTAHGNVRTRFLDRQSAQQKKEATAKAAAIFLEVTAQNLVYTEAERLAHYTGGARLTRPGFEVKASEIRAWFNESSSGSSLDRAFADGAVEVVRSGSRRTLTGTSEHAEYFAAEQKVILNRGDPTLVDSARGYTKGRELTYWADNDKLLVNGIEKEPVKTLIKRR
ncbi:MAG: LPS export ABC transporter periplasmic protein LptC [Rhodospirillales bacterium]